MRGIIVLSTQRSGSTMVCDDLAGTGLLGNPTEYFLKFMEINEPVNFKIEYEQICKKASTKNGCISFKIMSNQIDIIGKLIIDSAILKVPSPQTAFWEFFHKMVFVRVIRKDKVAQAVSRVLAKATNIYHLVVKGDNSMNGLLKTQYSDKEREEEHLQYSERKISNEIKSINKEEYFLDQFITRFNIEVTNLFYEKIIEDRSYVKNIGNQLGLNKVNLATRRLKKISGVIAKNWIDTYKGLE